MEIRTDFPFAVEERHVSVPMRDGVVLSGRIWVPIDADGAPVPAVLEMHPYRFDASDPSMRYVAGFGYAAASVSLRGTGNSEGVLSDEYTQEELDDACEVIAWLAAQSWCTGAVGMTGYSWSGFNALQVAALRPPQLRAIIAGCATDDRFEYDMHYAGGALLRDNMEWGELFQTVLMSPPDPDVVGDRWREMWRERVENAPLAIETWLRHQTRDDYWRHGSISEDYAAIDCAVLLIGGWEDMYTRPLLRMLERLEAPTRAIVGQWGHTAPHHAPEAFAIGYLTEAVRWWDRWLKNVDNGADREPALRAFITDAPSPDGSRTGRWAGEDWPSPRIRAEALPLPAAHVDGGSANDRLGYLPSTWVGRRRSGILQRPPGNFDLDPETAATLTFLLPPLSADLEILGVPVLELTVTADEAATITASLQQVRPDGTARELAIGIRNVSPGADSPRHVTIELAPIGRTIAAGDRLRVALTSRHWATWPAPGAGRFTVVESPDTVLRLPVLDGVLDPARPAVEFAAPETAEGDTTVTVAGETTRSLVESETADGIVLGLEERTTGSRVQFSSGWEGAFWAPSRLSRTQRVLLDEPASASDDVRRVTGFARGDVRTRLETRIVMTSTTDDYLVTATAEGFEGETRIASRAWSIAIPRSTA